MSERVHTAGRTTWKAREAALAVAAVFSVGCGGDGGGFDFATMGMGSAASASDSSGGASGESTAGDTVGDSDSSPTMGVDDDTVDSGDSPDSGSGGSSDDNDDNSLPVVPCTGIDLLFVVDNTETMLEEQIRIATNAASWIGMVNASAVTASNNINVGVITTDEPAFVTDTAMPCTFASGLPYMQYGSPAGAFDSVAFAEDIQCALNVGTNGDSNERPMDVLLESLSPTFVGGDGPNAGFLRDDALLVVVLLTDEEDDFEAKTTWGSDGDPPQWITDLADVKEGIEKDVVVLSFLGTDKPNACPVFQWDGMTGAEISPRLAEFTDGFPAGVVFDICAQDYVSLLNGVVPGVSGSCATFSPG